jgi:hypothetical protein
MASASEAQSKPRTSVPELVRAELSVRAAAWLAGQSAVFLVDAVREQGLCGRVEPERRGRWWPNAGSPNQCAAGSRERRAERELAERLCDGCPARLGCLALSYVLAEHGRWGIWGGLAAGDRHELRGLWERARADAESMTSTARTCADTSGRAA